MNCSLTSVGTLALTADGLQTQLSLAVWYEDRWKPLRLREAEADGYRGDGHGAHLALRLEPVSAYETRYRLRLEAEHPTRVQLRLALADASGCFHIIPGQLFGDNNLAKAEPGHFPHLTQQHPGNVSCSPYWEFRADRASHPVSLFCFAGGVAGVSITPYSDNAGVDSQGVTVPFVRNGVFAEIAHDGGADACGVTFPYRNAPCSFSNKDQWKDATLQATAAATAEGRLFLRPASDRRAAHDIIRRVYADGHEKPATPLSRRETMAALVDAFLRVNWHDATGRTALGTFSGTADAIQGGTLMAESFTNMCCRDPEKKRLTAWRMVSEVGWTGGGAIGYPLLAGGHRLGDTVAIERAVHMLDWVARAYNPASGLLWDVCGKGQTPRTDGWWAGYVVHGVHCAYTNGNGLYYLLKAYRLARDVRHEEHPAWLATGLKALDTIVKLQLPDGNFGYTYSPERPEVLDREGFAGVWFAPALLLAYQLTHDAKYLDAAQRGLAFYHPSVRDLNCCGTPMDTWKSPEEEGVLGFIRAARLLHEITGAESALAMLTDGVQYEFLWRYGFRARPQVPPLQGSHFSSCGGSITSVSNPHIHPMGLTISGEVDYLACRSGDPYYRQRCEDGLDWSVNIVSLYPEVSGYGIRGVLTERFCPSDGLLQETFADGSPSSLWFSYNAWAAAAVLEGLAESDG